MTTEIDKPLPFNLEAEKALLGAALLSDTAALEIVSLVRYDDFFREEHRHIFRHIEIVHANGGVPDLITVSESLRSAGQLETSGGAGYLASLIDGVPRVSNIRGYARIVRDKSLLRRLAYAADGLRQRALDNGEPATLIESSVSEILSIAEEAPANGGVRPWREVADSAILGLQDAIANPQKAKRIRFGLSDLDEMLGGLRPRELGLIVAQTSHGKTLMGAQCFFQASRDGIKTLFFSAEMPAEEVALREIAFQAKVKSHFVRRPEELRPEELAKLIEVSRVECSVRFVDANITPARIWSMAEAAKRTNGLDLVVVDYDQLVVEAGMNPTVQDDSVFRHQRDFIFRAKKMAQKLNITFLLISQLRKLSTSVLNGAAPNLDDIYGDSAMRNTPQVILWVSRDFFTHKMDIAYERKARVYVLKARNGRTGVVPLEFDPDYVRFLDQPPTEKDSVEERGR